MLWKQRAIRFAASIVTATAMTAAAAMGAAEARTLTFASAAAPRETGVQQAMQWWAEEIKECTGGSTDIKFYYMQSLVKLKDAVDAVSAGIADIAYVVPAYSQSKMPLWYLSSTGVGPGDQYVATEAFRRVRERFPSIKEEEKRNNMHYLGHYSIGPTVLMSNTRPYFTPEDFKGDKVRLASRYARAAKLEHWKVTPVNLSFPEIYSAMERGTIDGAVTYLIYIDLYKHNEVASIAVEPKLGQQTNPIFMNLGVWNNLSEQEQQCFNQAQTEFMHRMARGAIEDTNEAREELENDPNNPMEIHQLSAEQRQKWAEALRGAEQHNVEKTSRHNPQAPEIYEAYRKEMKKIEQEVAEQGYPWERN